MADNLATMAVLGFKMCDGSTSDNLLDGKWRWVRIGIEEPELCLGDSPLSWFFWSHSHVRAVSLPSSWGIGPANTTTFKAMNESKMGLSGVKDIRYTARRAACPIGASLIKALTG